MDSRGHGRHLLATAAAAIVVSALALDADANVQQEADAGSAPAAEPFVPGDIAIGEPIPLPFRGSGDAPAASEPSPEPGSPAPQPPAPAPPAPAAPTTPQRPGTAAVPGSGWLGLSIAESSVPGRWRIDDVAVDGPAARGGLAAGDELRAVNGTAIASADDLAQALTAIAAGDDVRLAVARADQVRDVVVRALPRPSTPAAAQPARPRDWQAASAPEPAPPAPPSTGPSSVIAPGGSAFSAAPALVTPEPPRTPAPALEAPGIADPSARGRTALGVRTLPVDPGMQARFHLPEPAGAYVFGVVQDLPASRAGVPPGSVIVALGDRPVRSPLELTRLVTSGPLDRPVTLDFILPGGEAKRAQVVLQALEAPLEQVLVGGATPAPGVPTLEPSPAPRRAERPVADEVTALRDELARLRRVIERLESRLERTSPAPR